MLRYWLVSINTLQLVMIYILLDITDFSANQLNSDKLKNGPQGIHVTRPIVRCMSSEGGKHLTIKTQLADTKSETTRTASVQHPITMDTHIYVVAHCHCTMRLK